jgi:hypothetical protein
MAIQLAEVVPLVDELTDDDKAELVVWLLERIQTHELTIEERLAVFDSMSIDLGTVQPGYSDRREDWYDAVPLH